MTLSQKSLELLKTLFSEQSNLSLPIGVAEQVMEIRKWVEEEVAQKDADV